MAQININALPEDTNPADGSWVPVDTASGTRKLNTSWFKSSTGALVALQNHLVDTIAAHAASAISTVPSAEILVSETVQHALDILETETIANTTNITDHVTDASAAHAATAIGFTPTGTVAATTVQAAIAEVSGDVTTATTATSDHVANPTAAHAASAISFTPTGTIAATNVQAALAEVAAEAGGGGGGGAVDSINGNFGPTVWIGAREGIPLESFAGANDDQKLGAAMTYCNAQTFPPTILLSENRDYGPFTTQRTVYSGFALVGASRPAGFYRGDLSTPQRVLVNTSGAWLTLPASGSIFDVYIANLSFYSQSSTCDFFGGTASGVLWTSQIRDCGWSLFRHVLGSPTTKFLNTACDFFSGYCNINNGRNTAISVGGSDSTFFMGGETLIDSPPGTYDSATRSHVRLDFQEKSDFGRAYITAEGTVAAVEILGSASSGAALALNGWVMEGRNAGQPSTGALVRVSGAKVKLRDCWVAYGMTSAAASPRGTENGLIHCISGAVVTVTGCTTSRATGVAESVPLIYGTGSGTHIRVKETDTDTSGGSWTGLPRYQVVSSATADVDGTVQL